MIITRRANISDLEWLLGECIAFSKTYQSKFSLAGDESYARGFLQNLIANHLVILSVKDGVRTGFIAGMVQQHHFNPSILMLSELLWWVSPEFRFGGSGAKLFLEFVNYGKEHCDCITMTLEETTPISDASLAKRGFRLTEKAYLMECN